MITVAREGFTTERKREERKREREREREKREKRERERERERERKREKEREREREREREGGREREGEREKERKRERGGGERECVYVSVLHDLRAGGVQTCSDGLHAPLTRPSSSSAMTATLYRQLARASLKVATSDRQFFRLIRRSMVCLGNLPGPTKHDATQRARI